MNPLQEYLSLVEIEDFEARYAKDITDENYFGYPLASILDAEKRLISKTDKSIAYFSMEYGLAPSIYHSFHTIEPLRSQNKFTQHGVFSNMRAMDNYFALRIDKRLDLPIYSGGLGVLAGDTLKSAADLGLSFVGIGILWNSGYFKQNFWFQDGQRPQEMYWDPKTYPGLIPLKNRIIIPLKNETIHVRLWKYYAYSYDQKSVVPLVLLDTNLPGNSEFARKLTGQLYRSDDEVWKLYQRLILGMGGIRALAELGYSSDVYHLNEGHAALAFVERARGFSEAQINDLKEHFAYTCHTPVSAGHDRFTKKTVSSILNPEDFRLLEKFGTDFDNHGLVNLTLFALNTCVKVNAVAAKHGQVMRHQFPSYAPRIQSITNGVHTYTWLSRSFSNLFKKYESEIGPWENDPSSLKNVEKLKNNHDFRRDLWLAHQENKHHLCFLLRTWQMKEDVLTVSWARRIAAYKRPSLILQDVHRLVDIARRHGGLQIILAGKAHPKDNLAETQINEILSAIDSLDKDRELIRVMMLENYDTFFGKLLTSSVDIWLNNPLPPFEASGTSGMKAILNGVLQMTTVDGWVVEASERPLGWFFGYRHEGGQIGNEWDLRLKEDSSNLYEVLEQAAQLYCRTNQKGALDVQSPWIDKMIECIVQSAYFNTQRMVEEYRGKIWQPLLSINKS
ncbi:MAG: alpha-glucan family phosphorylase [Candidatus Omnitrophica bacterium]|nr:alpha-glucan family phosphorylase [Candidatus Omnitrophota bacterium]